VWCLLVGLLHQFSVLELLLLSIISTAGHVARASKLKMEIMVAWVFARGLHPYTTCTHVRLNARVAPKPNAELTHV
jgi:hypothetical protein